MRLNPGTRVGPYEVIAPLGSGGMGEVYRARDSKLGRDVALKILPAAVAADPDRLARFEREARVLASLNHPNIGSIYGFDDADGLFALVLELIDGPTLEERIGGRPVPVPDALAIARQIAEALDAAHEAGIVHRDLKPANVKIRPDGAVKILDFGLAKALADGATLDLAHAPTITAAGTAAGVVMGTPAYMSPEQARGQAADKRADVWAFGCVLYEMLTGRRAFDGRTVSDTIVAVLAGEPDWTALPSTTPSAVRRLLRRCFERDPKSRLRDMGDALPDLRRPDAHAEDGLAVRAPSAPRGFLRWGPWLLAAMAAGTAVVAVMWNRDDDGTSPGLVETTIEQLTYDGGLTTMPTLSPDGNLVAYASDRAGRGDLDIWVQRTAGGDPLRLTDDPADDQMPHFSPDGSQIVFRSERAGGGIYLVSAFGGSQRRIVQDGRDPKFAPDGKRIAYWTGTWRNNPEDAGTTLFVASLDGGEPTRIVPEFRSARKPAWSPDGRSLLILGRRDDAIDTFDWWWVPLDGRPPVQTGLFALASPRATYLSAHIWTASGVVFSAGAYNLSSVQLSPVGKAVGPIRALTAMTGAALHPSASGGSLVFAAVNRQRVIARASLGEEALEQRPVPLYVDARPIAARASPSADGSVLVFEQWFPTHREIWKRNVRSGQQEMVLRIDAAAPLNPTVSPDGARIAYTVVPEGYLGTGYVLEVLGGVPRRVCDACSLHGFLSDNRRVLARFGGQVLGAIDSRDGSRQELVRTASGALNCPHISPDDRWLAFRHSTDVGGETYVAPVSPGRPAERAAWQHVDEPTTTGRPAGWSLDSRVLYLLLDTDGFRCLWGQRIDGATGGLSGGPFAVRHFHDINEEASTSFGNAIAADGFVFETVRHTGNLWRLVLR